MKIRRRHKQYRCRIVNCSNTNGFRNKLRLRNETEGNGKIVAKTRPNGLDA